ncbi:F-box domain-containing protein [Citrus sinensis]|uniref:F-box domain-containing protein n=1 Tax=Citrus sinensis TaxID=2711 RepID=A0ACB8M3M3_CITSI|nr:F-box domain-containing protein [Citrus sinensis]
MLCIFLFARFNWVPIFNKLETVTIWCCKVCRNWKVPASNDILWLNLFRERWGEDDAAFYAPAGSKSWKDVYEVQDRCGRVGLGLKIIREGVDYYLVHQGEIQRHLGSRRQRKRDDICPSNSTEEEKSSQGILDRILFFIGDLEVASADAKRGRLL